MTWAATIVESSPRAADWLHVFGDHTVPVLVPLPRPANLPGLGVQDVYLLDVDALDAGTRARLVQHLANRFGLEAAEVEQDLDRAGCPILASDVAVPIPLRFFVGDDVDDDDDDPWVDEFDDDEATAR